MTKKLSDFLSKAAELYKKDRKESKITPDSYNNNYFKVLTLLEVALALPPGQNRDEKLDKIVDWGLE